MDFDLFFIVTVQRINPHRAENNQTNKTMSNLNQVKILGWRQLLFLWMLLLPVLLWAQSGITVTWDT